MVNQGGGACVVVRTRESRAHGEDRQGTDRVAKPEEPSVDLGNQADEAWLLSVQRKLYQWSRTHPADSYRDVWNWITDIRNLRCAWRKIALNNGRRTAGLNGITVAGIKGAMCIELFLEQLHGDLPSGRYKPSPRTEADSKATSTGEIPTSSGSRPCAIA
jgi:RNA-directed DNA polymerase